MTGKKREFVLTQWHVYVPQRVPFKHVEKIPN